MYKVLVSDLLSQQGLDVLKADDDFEVDVILNLSGEALLERIAAYDALLIRSATKVTKDVIDVATRLKVIGRAGVGVDNIDVQAATRNGILVVNTPTGNTIAAAERYFGCQHPNGEYNCGGGTYDCDAFGVGT
jgi:D-3-phosphoglycerate dehydrogenase